MTYLTCPICQNRLRTMPDFHYAREDTQDVIKDSVCVTTVKVKSSVPIYHYRKSSVNSTSDGQFFYSLRIPPYTICWWNEDGHAEVVDENDELILEQENITFKEYIDLYYRFEKLKVFI